jgi:hypothetical protein
MVVTAGSCSTTGTMGGGGVGILPFARLTTTEIYTQVSIKKLKEIHTATHPARAKRERPGDGKKTDQGDKKDMPKSSP